MQVLGSAPFGQGLLCTTLTTMITAIFVVMTTSIPVVMTTITDDVRCPECGSLPKDPNA